MIRIPDNSASFPGEFRLARIFAAILLVLVIISPGFSQEEDEEEFTQTAASEIKQDDVKKALEAFNAGQEAHSKGDLQKAMSLYLEAVRLIPEFPEAEYQIGKIHEEEGRLEKAEESFRKSMSYKPDWTLPMSALGGVLVERGELDEARGLLEKTLSLDGQCIPCYPALTEIYLRQGADKQKLEVHLQKLTILTSKLKIPAAIWASKAAIERTSGDLTAASESIRRGLVVDPSNISLLSERVEISLLKGDAEGAAATARLIIRKAPESRSAKFQLARAEYLAGRDESSMEILESIRTDFPQAEELIARIVSRQEEDPEKLEEELQTDPENPNILGRLCNATRLSAPKKSLEFCLKASEAEPSNVSHAIGYAAALLQLKRYSEAAALLDRLKKFSPDNFTIRANFATALFQLKRYQQAKNEYLWLLSRDPNLAAAYYFLAICDDRLENHPDALAHYRTFLRLAEEKDFSDEIERVQLRLPILERQIRKN